MSYGKGIMDPWHFSCAVPDPNFNNFEITEKMYSNYFKPRSMGYCWEDKPIKVAKPNVAPEYNVSDLKKKGVEKGIRQFWDGLSKNYLSSEHMGAFEIGYKVNY